MKPPRKPPPAVSWPWDPVKFEDPWELSAIKAMAADHPKAVEIICKKFCREDRMSFTVGIGADGARATDFAEGKRHVASQLREAIAMKMPGQVPVETGPHAVPKGPPPED